MSAAMTAPTTDQPLTAQTAQQDQRTNPPPEPTGDETSSEQDIENFDSSKAQQATAKVVEQSPKKRFSRFNDLLGEGSFKKVYRAFDATNGIDVAWNAVSACSLASGNGKRIIREMKMLQNLDHEHIIKFYGSWVNVEKRNLVFITHLSSGGALSEFIASRPVRLCILKRWCREILSALEYLHGHEPPIIHRDLKCDNIFVSSSSGKILIGDLGLASWDRGSQDKLSCLGTPEYMAPELYESTYDEQVDIYAFGLCVLEMATSEKPYAECTNACQIFRKVTTGVLPRALDRIPSGSALREFILSAVLMPDQGSRRPSASQLAGSHFLVQDKEDDLLMSDLLVPLKEDEAITAVSQSSRESAEEGDSEEEFKSPASPRTSTVVSPRPPSAPDIPIPPSTSPPTSASAPSPQRAVATAPQPIPVPIPIPARAVVPRFPVCDVPASPVSRVPRLSQPPARLRPRASSPTGPTSTLHALGGSARSLSPQATSPLPASVDGCTSASSDSRASSPLSASSCVYNTDTVAAALPPVNSASRASRMVRRATSPTVNGFNGAGSPLMRPSSAPLEPPVSPLTGLGAGAATAVPPTPSTGQAFESSSSLDCSAHLTNNPNVVRVECRFSRNGAKSTLVDFDFNIVEDSAEECVREMLQLGVIRDPVGSDIEFLTEQLDRFRRKFGQPRDKDPIYKIRARSTSNGSMTSSVCSALSAESPTSDQVVPPPMASAPHITRASSIGSAQSVCSQPQMQPAYAPGSASSSPQLAPCLPLDFTVVGCEANQAPPLTEKERLAAEAKLHKEEEARELEKRILQQSCEGRPAPALSTVSSLSSTSSTGSGSAYSAPPMRNPPPPSHSFDSRGFVPLAGACPPVAGMAASPGVKPPRLVRANSSAPQTVRFDAFESLRQPRRPGQSFSASSHGPNQLGQGGSPLFADGHGPAHAGATAFVSAHVPPSPESSGFQFTPYSADDAALPWQPAFESAETIQKRHTISGYPGALPPAHGTRRV